MARVEIINTLTEVDRQRAESVETTPHMLSRAHHAGVQAVELFGRTFVFPIISGAIAKSDREVALSGLYFRMQLYSRSVLKLDEPRDFQSLVAASRSVLELYLDAELINQDKILDGVAKFHAFADTQRLSAARKTARFFDDNPALDTKPSAWDPQRAFIAQQATRIDAQTASLWGANSKGSPNEPAHWSGLDMKSRGVLLGKEFELLVQDGYHFRNWLIHSGLVGVGGLDVNSFNTLASDSLHAVHTCMLGVLRILGIEFKLSAAINDLARSLVELERVPAWALLDLKLQGLGEASRFRLAAE